jgi:catechol 2,3-dioxygenase-like lactoylglutathione lyase family enzyme
MKPLQLHHASIRVHSLERSQAFYSDLLRLQTIARPDLGVRGTWYGIGGGQLHLIEGEGFGAKIDPSGPHFAIRMGTPWSSCRCVPSSASEARARPRPPTRPPEASGVREASGRSRDTARHRQRQNQRMSNEK